MYPILSTPRGGCLHSQSRHNVSFLSHQIGRFSYHEIVCMCWDVRVIFLTRKRLAGKNEIFSSPTECVRQLISILGIFSLVPRSLTVSGRRNGGVREGTSKNRENPRSPAGGRSATCLLSSLLLFYHVASSKRTNSFC